MFELQKKHGIRVVGIDTLYTYSEHYNKSHQEYYGQDPMGTLKDEYRIKSMNYTAARIIEKEMQSNPGKWVALIGNLHCRKFHDVPGLSELTNAKTALITSREETKELSVNYNNTLHLSVSFGGEKESHSIPYDVMINSNEKYLDTPLLDPTLTSSAAATAAIPPQPVKNRQISSLDIEDEKILWRANQELERLQHTPFSTTKVNALKQAIENKDINAIKLALEIKRYPLFDKIFKRNQPTISTQNVADEEDPKPKKGQ